MKLIAPLMACVVVLMVSVWVVLVLVVAAAVYGLYRGGRAYLDFRSRQASQLAHRRAELAAAAELQHRWYLDGDPRGTYGRYTPQRVVKHEPSLS